MASPSGDPNALQRALSRHVPALDGLRGCAVLMVLYYHTCGMSKALSPAARFLPSLGWSGVNLFFVLSGFLITNILLQNSTAATYYGPFYARRALRIVPVYYLALLWIFLMEPAIYHRFYPTVFRTHYTWHTQIWYWLNVSNLRSAWHPMEIPTATVLWSLGIEEQFYALWPFVVRRVKERRLVVVCIAGILLSVVLRCLPIVQRYSLSHAGFLIRFTPFQLDGLLAGALLAVYLRQQRRPAQIRKLVARLFFTGLLVLLWASRGFTDLGNPGMGKYAFTGLALVFAAVVCLCVVPTGRMTAGVSRLFSTTVLRSFGKYSYFLYVFHPIIVGATTGHVLIRMTRGMAPVEANYIAAVVGIAESYLAAAISWRLMERPILNLRGRFPYRPKNRSVLEEVPLPVLSS